MLLIHCFIEDLDDTMEDVDNVNAYTDSNTAVSVTDDQTAQREIETAEMVSNGESSFNHNTDRSADVRGRDSVSPSIGMSFFRFLSLLCLSITRMVSDLSISRKLTSNQ